MRWWAGVWVVAGVAVLAACGSSAGGGGAGGSGSRSSEPSAGTSASASAGSSGVPSAGTSAPPPASASASATGGGPSTSPAASASLTGCAAGHTDVTITPGGAVEQRLCVRPGTVVSLVLRPRADDKRWTAVHSSAPAFVLPSGWRVAADGTAHATLRCATVRPGAADVRAMAKAPDTAGAARPAFTLHLSVVPYPTQG
ncbi:hypothetical protein [Streptomyces sp. NPDC047079]|uniref:hypothetical protein n=1 Tax=Streptomyces sp. NPDC047079 TaxID=3154607 RepID=UPI0033EB0DE2